MLQDHLSPVPIACLRCNGEVSPETVGFSADLVEKLASWRTFHRAFMTLWLDSGEYESWARSELQRPDAPVNVRGRQAVAALNQHRRTYFWWFQDATADDFSPAATCPLCDAVLAEAFGKLVCNRCSVVVPNG